MNCQFSFFELLCHYHSKSKIYNFYGGELSVHTNPETLGDIIKYYREKSDFTVEELAYKVGISERYLYRIENEGKKPSFDVLYRLIRTLAVSPELIFYPETKYINQRINSISNLLIGLSEKDINSIEIIIKALYC